MFNFKKTLFIMLIFSSTTLSSFANTSQSNSFVSDSMQMIKNEADTIYRNLLECKKFIEVKIGESLNYVKNATSSLGG